jgi:hypothetical protein
MSLRDHLQAIYDQRGALTPALVVQEATDASHPLHDYFEWDDAEAGAQWRLNQARQLIRSVKIVYREATDQERRRMGRGYLSVRRENGPVYVPAAEVIADPFTKRLVLADMEREWKALLRRYSEFAEFAEMVQADLSGKGEAA